MKKGINIKSLILISLIAVLCGCEDKEGKYEMTNGEPTIYYVRSTDPTQADALLNGAYMGETICLVGENLTSIQEIYFNDVKASLNINYITPNTLILAVPTNVPEEKTDKIYMVLKSGKTVDYGFVVGIPSPTISRLVCEHVPAGGTVALEGDYFFDYPDAPMVITIDGYTVPHENIISVEKTKVKFVAPEEDVKGYIMVTTTYGSTVRSHKTLFRDMSGLITGFEADENGGSGFVGGWGRPSESQLQEDPEYALTGRYLKWSGALTAGAWSSGTPDYALNIWSQSNSGMSDPMFTTDPDVSVLKFEIYVVEAWSCLPIIVCFDAANTNENYLWADGTMPRAFYAPWTTTGSYVSEGWETVSIPLTDIKYSGDGTDIGMPVAFGQLGIAMHNRGGTPYVGSDCSPVILIDNIRVVSTE